MKLAYIFSLLFVLFATLGCSYCSRAAFPIDSVDAALPEPRLHQSAVSGAMKASVSRMRSRIATITQPEQRPKDNVKMHKWVAAVLCFFLGFFGAHRFYLGYIMEGVTQFVGTTLCTIATLYGFIGLLEFFFLRGANSNSLLFLVLGLTGFSILSLWILCDFVRILCGDIEPKHRTYYRRPRKVKPS